MSQPYKIRVLCLVCGEEVPRLADGTYRSVHIACITCPVCGGTMHLDKRTDTPAVLTCYGCIYRADAAAVAAKEEAKCARIETALALLLDCGGTRDERDAAIDVIADYYFDLGNS